jgi:hypothetical protein
MVLVLLLLMLLLGDRGVTPAAMTASATRKATN